MLHITLVVHNVSFVVRNVMLLHTVGAKKKLTWRSVLRRKRNRKNGVKHRYYHL